MAIRYNYYRIAILIFINSNMNREISDQLMQQIYKRNVSRIHIKQ